MFWILYKFVMSKVNVKIFQNFDQYRISYSTNLQTFDVKYLSIVVK